MRSSEQIWLHRSSPSGSTSRHAKCVFTALTVFRNPHMVWARAEPFAPLAALHRKVDRAVARVGIARDARAFVPHITLARLNRASGPVAPFIALHNDLASAPFVFDSFTLYESELAQGGSRYHPVVLYPLASATSAAATALTSAQVAAKPSASP